MNWDNIATKLGYESFPSMFVTLYTIRRYSINTIANELGCDIQTIRRLIKKNDLGKIIRRSGRVVTKVNEKELIGTLDEAAHNTGVPRSTIWYRRKRIKSILAAMEDVGEPISLSEVIPDSVEKTDS